MFKTTCVFTRVYHSGYQNQMTRWPVKPIEVIIRTLKLRSPNLTVADIGCGEGSLALSLPNKVHSFDLCKVKDHIVICDAAQVHTKLDAASSDDKLIKLRNAKNRVFFSVNLPLHFFNEKFQKLLLQAGLIRREIM